MLGCFDCMIFGTSVAYMKDVVHIYSYHGGDDLQNHLESKGWDVERGAKQFKFDDHETPVYSICPHFKDAILQPLLSSSSSSAATFFSFFLSLAVPSLVYSRNSGRGVGIGRRRSLYGRYVVDKCQQVCFFFCFQPPEVAIRSELGPDEISARQPI
ncbi:putative Topless family protein [Helianthus annuus]|nr:putative Topless family protein [Helianthus annuus]